MNRFTQLAAAFVLAAALPALAFNHELVVNPLAPGKYAVACTNIAQDPALIAQIGGNPEDFWEGRPVNDQPRYIDQILAAPSTALQFDVTPPNDRTLYANHAGITTHFVAIVCHPTPATNDDPDYV